MQTTATRCKFTLKWWNTTDSAGDHLRKPIRFPSFVSSPSGHNSPKWPRNPTTEAVTTVQRCQKHGHSSQFRNERDVPLTSASKAPTDKFQLLRASSATHASTIAGFIHDELYRLNSRDRVTFKMAVMINRCLNSGAPDHPALSSQRHPRSADWNLLQVPQHRPGTISRPRAFAIAGPTAWNSLPDPDRSPNVTETVFGV